MSLSKNQIKRIASLQQKKHRQKLQLFVVEGVKGVEEFLNSPFKVEEIFHTDDFFIKKKIQTDPMIMHQISEHELQKISTLKSPNKVLAIVQIPPKKILKQVGLVVGLEDVNDPGNLGTIIRLCDWFGISHLICSMNTVDCYNTKVVQASMGSLSRVNVTYVDLLDYVKTTSKQCFIADMNGKNVYESNLPKDALLIMGNEANGISNELKLIVDASISIPAFGEFSQTESLNVATATAILLSEFKRKVFCI